MGVVRTWSSLALLLIQIFSAHAHQPEFVFGPKKFLDSGQESVTRERHKPLLDNFQHKTPLIYYYDSNEELDYDEEDDDFLLPQVKKTLEEEEEIGGIKVGRSYESIYEDSGEDSYEFATDDDEDEEAIDDGEVFDLPINLLRVRRSSFDIGNTVYGNINPLSFSEYPDQLVLRRLRRRIIPVGKALDRDRAGRNPYDRSRSPWEESPNKNRDSVVRRNGPTGSAALFSLYPELASPEQAEQTEQVEQTQHVDEAEQTSIKPIKKSSHRERDTEAIHKRTVEINNDDMGRDVRELEEVEKPVRTKGKGGNSKAAAKKRLKLSKQMKEDIAMYADAHGIEQTIAHFKSRISTQLKAATIEKFLRRYQSRLQRRVSRKPIRS